MYLGIESPEPCRYSCNLQYFQAFQMDIQSRKLQAAFCWLGAIFKPLHKDIPWSLRCLGKI